MVVDRGTDDKANPKYGAGSGIVRSSSVGADEGPKTTRATGTGESIVDAPEQVSGHKEVAPAEEQVSPSSSEKEKEGAKKSEGKKRVKRVRRG